MSDETADLNYADPAMGMVPLIQVNLLQVVNTRLTGAQPLHPPP